MLHHYKNAQYHCRIGSPKSMAIAMPAHKNGPKAKWSLFVGPFGGQQPDAVKAAAQNAQKHRQQRVLPAEKQPGGRHQLDVAAAERAVNGKAEQKHRHADAERPEQVGQPPGGGEQRPYNAADRQREIEPVGDKLCLGVNERDAQQNAADRQRGERRPAHAEQPLRQAERGAEAPGAAQRQHAAQHLDQKIPHRDARAAVAAPPAQKQPAENRHKVGRAQRMAALRACAASLQGIHAPRQPPGHDIHKAEQRRAQQKNGSDPKGTQAAAWLASVR